MKFHLRPLHYYIIVFSLFLGICAWNLLPDGMFMDGVYYAAIAKNLANGIGSFWYPHFSDTLHNPFHEHPPLVFGLQAIFFYIFGNSIYVERFYSLGTFIICGILLVLIWKRLGGECKTGWIPLMLWILIPKIWWACSNNILENTMSIFLCVSVLFYLISIEKYRFPMIALGGISLLLGFLSKGFTALYIFSFPFWFWLFAKKRSFMQMIADSIVLAASAIIPLLLLFLVSPDAFDSLSKYFNKQVLTSVMYTERVTTRFYIVYRMFIELLPVLFIAISAVILNFSRKIRNDLIPKDSIVFLLLSLSGVLPIMVTLKQSGFYITTTYPFFAISFGIIVKPVVTDFIKQIEESEKMKRIIEISSYCLLALSIIISLAQVNRSGRDKETLEMVYDFTKIIPDNSVINIQDDLWTEFGLHAYFSRHGNISLDKDTKNRHEYYLGKKDSNMKPFKNMKKLREVNGYILFKLKK